MMPRVIRWVLGRLVTTDRLLRMDTARFMKRGTIAVDGRRGKLRWNVEGVKTAGL